MINGCSYSYCRFYNENLYISPCRACIGGSKYEMKTVVSHMDPASLNVSLRGFIGRTVNKNFVPNIKDVIFNCPATIVLWEDGTKTVVKTQGDDTYDPEKGLAMAICKKLYGNTGSYNDKLTKWINKYNEKKAKESK